MKHWRTIIENRTTKPDSEVFAYVASVMREGRISNNGTQYCYATRFADGVLVYTDLNKASDRFVITDERSR